MKAIAKCPECGEKLETDCGGCIIAGTTTHVCKGKDSDEIIAYVKWEKVPETGKGLQEVEKE